MVAGAAVPIKHRSAGVGTELHHTKRGGSAWVSVAMAAGANEGVDVTGDC